jgi:lysophospholipase L1-like esterase
MRVFDVWLNRLGIGTLGLALALVLCSCNSPRQKIVRESDYPQPIRVACIGDSITYGYGFKDRERDSYPAKLGALLGSKWDVRNFGVNGATVLEAGTRPYVTQQAYRDALGFKPHVVIIKLGTNDTKKENYGAHQAEFAPDYLDIIRSFATLKTKPRIFVCLPVPIFRDRGKEFDTDKVLTQQIIPEINQVARRARIPVIDLYRAFNSKSELFPDGVHPNAMGTTIMAQEIYSTLAGTKGGHSLKGLK